MFDKVPLLEEVLKYKKENNLIFSMPGNKSGRAFLRDEIGKEFVNYMGYLDITEVDPLDNLHCPEGVILQAEKLLAASYGVNKAFFVVNGSTAGNMAAVFAAFNEGDEVLVERNCHKSIYNALILKKIKVVFIEPIIDKENNIFLPPDEEKINKALGESINPKGIILTYPSYFGITYDIEKIINKLKAQGIKVILDAAHGAHFGMDERLPKQIYSLVDYTVVSAHKTLPALTQGSYLLVNNDEDNIEFYLRAFMTTSPSYLIMSSLDYARYYLDKYGREDYKRLIDTAEKWKEQINYLGKIRILDEHDLPQNYEIDKTRYVLILPKGYSGHKLLDCFRSKNVQCEMSFSSGVVLILSPCNTEGDFKKLYKTIEELDMNLLRSNENIAYYDVVPSKIMEPYEVFKKKSINIEIEKAENKIAKEFIIPYPPGIPLVAPGEVIKRETIEIVQEYLENGRVVIGVNDYLIKVVAEE